MARIEMDVTPDGDKSLQEIQSEEILIPMRLALGYQTRRPELLNITKGPMDEAEARATIDLLAGEMRMNDVLKRRVSELEDVVADRIAASTRVYKALEETAKELRQEARELEAIYTRKEGRNDWS